MPMVIVQIPQLAEWKRRGVVVMCSQCELANERRPEKGTCQCTVTRTLQNSDVPRLCTEFRERH